MRTYQRIVLFGVSGILAISLSACIKTDHLYLGQERYPPHPDVFRVEFLTDPPSRPYVKLAMVEAREDDGDSTWEELREALSEEAKKVGADAVMDLSMGGTPIGMIAGSSKFVAGGMGEKKKLTGVAIRYK